ncbi:MAG TPA: SDR family oxidoreductase [Nitrospirales bacterium]|nr:SDR family oxidoreductase [Nitrospirales bacterium]
MKKYHKKEVVVITGASAGIGRATVRAFARRGAHLGLLARGQEGLEAARQEVQKLGGQAVIIPTDVADPDQVEGAAAKVEKTFGPIDIWINNAMTSVLSPVKHMTAEEFQRVTNVTYLGYVYGTLSALRRMLPRDRGVIIQVGSALSYRAIPLQSAYCGAKHAVKGFTESLRSELIHDRSRVRITMVQLPGVNTTQFGWIKSRMPYHPQPVPPIYQPEVMARAIVWSADHDRRELWVGMPTVKTIIGEKFIPGLLDHYLAEVAYEGQQTQIPINPDRPDNLWTPVAQDRGAHGPFDHRARSSSFQLWASMHRGLLAVAGVACLLSLGWARSRSPVNRRHQMNQHKEESILHSGS